LNCFIDQVEGILESKCVYTQLENESEKISIDIRLNKLEVTLGDV